MEIRYEHLNPENFDAYSLDTFQRRQAVKECWRYVDGMWQLRPVYFEENWDLPQLREIAGDIAAHMTVDQSAFGAFAGDQAVGFITVSHVFHVTNTHAVITLMGVAITNEDAENVLLSVCDDGWNGAGNQAEVNAFSQVLEGSILVGDNASLSLSLSEGSTFTGSISGEIANSKGETVSTQVGEVSVTLDGDSTWTLTGDSYITSFTGDAAQVISGGYTLYVNGVALEGTR